jgi:hypothetical protein
MLGEFYMIHEIQKMIIASEWAKDDLTHCFARGSLFYKIIYYIYTFK